MSYSDGARQPNIATACTNREPDGASWNGPALSDNVPDRKVVPRQLHRNGLALSGCEVDVVKALQAFGGRLRRGGKCNIKLRDLKFC